MHIVCVGISHHTAPVELREKLALDPEAIAPTLRKLHEQYPNTELTLLSTCNRTELYMARPLHGHPRVDETAEWFANHAQITTDSLAEHLYHHENENALQHLMHVTAGLDSMAIGEAQILGQVKHAHQTAQQANTIGKVLNHAFREAVTTAKHLRTNTGIGDGKTSISSVAVDFAKHLFHDFNDKTLLVLGAGKMIDLTLRHFLELKPTAVHIANRSLERADKLAAAFPNTPTQTHTLDNLDQLLTEADIIISSTAATQPVVTTERMKPLIKKRRFRPLFIIDIAVPRDFDPNIGKLANLYLYDLDDLQSAIADHAASRNGSVAQCHAIINQAVAQTYAAIQTHDFSDLIKKLRTQLHDLGSAETQRTINKLQQAQPDQLNALLEEHTQRLVNKILHRPVTELGKGRGPQSAMYATAIRRLFELGPDTEDTDSPPEPTTPPSAANKPTNTKPIT